MLASDLAQGRDLPFQRGDLLVSRLDDGLACFLFADESVTAHAETCAPHMTGYAQADVAGFVWRLMTFNSGRLTIIRKRIFGDVVGWHHWPPILARVARATAPMRNTKPRAAASLQAEIIASGSRASTTVSPSFASSSR